ncbi:MAG: glutamate--cysteine ligase [Persicimonas sp.]
MAREIDENAVPIDSYDQLVAYFQAGEKEPSNRAIGTEHEKFLFRRSDHRMVSYEESGGIGDVLEGLVRECGFEPVYDGDNVVALDRDDTAISLEPGGQFELAGGIRRTIFETADELDDHLEMMRRVLGDRFAMVCWGLNPFFEPEDVPWMPKSRYVIMREYLPTRGDLAHWMMKLTCTVQANFDYTGEDDAADLMRTTLLISPIVSAIFANSPIKAGRDTGMQTYRGYLWTRTDPDRCGWPEFMYGDDWGYRDYLEYVLDVPMFFIKRDGRLIDKAGDSFREFIEEGHGDFEANMGDFELHLSTLFPEVRLKRFVEVRGADAGPRDHLLAVPALWKGLLYHQPSRDAARGLLDHLSPERHRQLFMDAYRDGLEATVDSTTVAELAAELLRLAEEGLDALAEVEGHPSEREFLAPVRRVVESRTTLADRLREDWQRFEGDAEEIVGAWEF